MDAEFCRGGEVDATECGIIGGGYFFPVGFEHMVRQKPLKTVVKDCALREIPETPHLRISVCIVCRKGKTNFLLANSKQLPNTSLLRLTNSNALPCCEMLLCDFNALIAGLQKVLVDPFKT